MKIIGIGIDYSNICKDFNTGYLDRDNIDEPDTAKCIKQVLAWTKDFFHDMTEHFGYKIYKLNSNVTVPVAEVASKRFLFYSLEKGITDQSFTLQTEGMRYNSFNEWTDKGAYGTFLKNDEDGSGIYLYFQKDSDFHAWLMKKLEHFSLEEIDI